MERVRNIRLIVADLDGTLLIGNNVISKRCIGVLKTCQEKGIQIGFVTSRNKSMILKYVEQLEPDFYITSSGSLVIYKNKIIYQSSFSTEDTRKIIEDARHTCGEDVELLIDTVNDFYWNQNEDNEIEDNQEEIKYSDFIDFNEEALKICIKTNEENASWISKSVPFSHFCPLSDNSWYCFQKNNDSIENALRIISKEAEIPLEQMIAFGNDYTNLEMLKQCGIGVAVQNAVLEVKQVADAICDYNSQDGVAKYLETYLQIEAQKYWEKMARKKGFYNQYMFGGRFYTGKVGWFFVIVIISLILFFIIIGKY